MYKRQAEYLIPIFIGELLEQGKMSVKVLKTNDTWYGMTYHEDVAAVKDSFKKMLENGLYKADLLSLIHILIGKQIRRKKSMPICLGIIRIII